MYERIGCGPRDGISAERIGRGPREGISTDTRTCGVTLSCLADTKLVSNCNDEPC